MRSILHNRVFVVFWSANLVSSLGDALRTFTVILWVYQVSNGSGLAIAALTAMQVVPSAVLGTLAGALVDRWDRRRTLLVCDLARGLLSVGLFGAAHFDLLWLGLVLLALSTAFTVVADIAGATVVPRLVPDHDLERANGLWTVMQQSAYVVGPGLAALAFTRAGPEVAFALDAVSFAVSGVLLLVGLPALKAAQPERPTPQPPSLLRESLDGLRYVRRDPLVGGALLAMTLRVLSGGINNTIMIFFIATTLGRPAADLAWLGSVNGLAQIVVGGLVVAAAGRTALHRSLGLGSLAMALGGVVIAVAPNLTVLMAGVILTSIGNAPVNIGQTTLEQRFVPGAMLGRVRGLQESLLTVGYLAASGLGGVLVAPVGARTLLVASAALLVLAAAITATRVLPPLRQHQRSVALAPPT